MVPYKVDMASDENIMPLYIYKNLFPRATIQQLAVTRNTNIKLKTYNQTTITQWGIGSVKSEHNNKHKMFNFFVVPGNEQALLGIPDVKIQNILTINCNTIGTEEVDMMKLQHKHTS